MPKKSVISKAAKTTESAKTTKAAETTKAAKTTKTTKAKPTTTPKSLKSAQTTATSKSTAASTPTISVIVTGLNAEPYLATCLDSILSQTFTDLEIICVDDGSTDGTAAILQSYAAAHPQIHVITNQTPRLPGAARNQALELARGQFIMFSDADDYYAPEMCEHLLHAITTSGADLAVSEANVIYHAHHEMKPSDDIYYGLKFVGLQDMVDGLALSTDLSVQVKIFRRSLIDSVNLRFPEGLFYEDAYFCIAYFCLCQTVYYLNERLYNYIRHHHSVMSDAFDNNTTDHAIDHLAIACQLYDFLDQHQLLAQYNTLFWHIFQSFTNFAIIFSKTNARRKAVRAQARAFIAAHPDSFQQLSPDLRQQILDFISNKFHLSTSRLKRLLLRFMPSLRRSIYNVLDSRVLLKRDQDLLRQTNRVLGKYYLDDDK